MAEAKRVAVLGSGACGLVSIKWALQEGLDVTCFEKSDDIGGLWRYTADSEEGRGSVFQSTIINTSKEMMSFTDFPPPTSFAPFMHQSQVLEYFRSYADRFRLLRHIEFHTEVTRIEPSPDHDRTGRWTVKSRNVETKKEKEETFDFVMVASGHHTAPRIPTWPGLDKFKGDVRHTKNYKTTRGYENKKVVVIGIGNSGGDAAVELSRVTKRVFLSTRNGSWILNRISDYGDPLDMRLGSRLLTLVLGYGNMNVISTIVEAMLNKRFDHARYGLKPPHRVISQHPMVNDEMPNKVAAGTVTIKNDVVRFDEMRAYFTDGSVEEVDSVLLATGYNFEFPFLDERVFSVKDNEAPMYLNMWPLGRQHNTLCIMGCVQPLGAIVPITDVQAQWAVRVFKGLNKLPSQTLMTADYQKTRDDMRRVFTGSPRHTIQVNYVEYTDKVAAHFGARPSFLKLLLTDPAIGFRFMFGPALPYYWRLVGPYPWLGARQAILGAWERTNAALRTRPTLPLGHNETKSKPRSSVLLKKLFFVAAVVAFLAAYLGYLPQLWA